MGVTDEQITPADLIAEAYERLPAEDKLALRAYAPEKTQIEPVNDALESAMADEFEERLSGATDKTGQVGQEFILSVPTIEYGNDEINVFTLPNPRPGRLQVQKGFAAWDLLPGHFVLHAAGGVAVDLQGDEIALDYGFNSLPEINAAMRIRREFIATGGRELAEEIRRTIHS